MRKTKIKTIPIELLHSTVQANRKISDVLRAFDIPLSHSHSRRLVAKIAKELGLTAIYNEQHSFTIEELKIAVTESICYSDVLRHIGLSTFGCNGKTIRRLIKKENIDISHFDLRKALSRNRIYNAESMLIENSPASKGVVKAFIRKNDLIEYKCKDCANIGSHNNKPLMLQLEHMNGVNNDHTLGNLCFLCPNCHSQTPTYTGRNKKPSGKIL